MDSQLNQRIQRIYAAIGEVTTTDPSTFQSEIRHLGGNNFVAIMDFQGALTLEQLQNIIYSVIYNVANLRDHLKIWAKHKEENVKVVDQAVNTSTELKVIIDLSNRDKHGGTPRDGGLSGLLPDLTNYQRKLVIPAMGKENVRSSFTFSLFDGEPEVQFHGQTHVQISADIVNSKKQKIGDIMKYLDEAVSQWEQVLSIFGLSDKAT